MEGEEGKSLREARRCSTLPGESEEISKKLKKANMMDVIIKDLNIKNGNIKNVNKKN